MRALNTFHGGFYCYTIHEHRCQIGVLKDVFLKQIYEDATQGCSVLCKGCAFIKERHKQKICL
ncbi:hypothetical protein CEV08_07355 [Bartonella tribocorum]|uniref:Uncharacterized protein n=1 Tax=Bartonella tribocorum TaxID=85701 RepID=A0A2M6URL9_9HYPH|nr:hypothetical protein CEV08_07355 [Bartonella tribocorum]